MSDTSRAVASAVVAVLCGAAVTLWASGFFEAWDGRAVSHRPRRGEADLVQVRVVTGVASEELPPWISPAGDTPDPRVTADRAFETWWPAAVVLPLDLAVDADPSEPPVAGTGLATHKDRFTTHFTVQGVPGTVSTGSAGSVSLGVFVAAGALLLRNMWVGGAPWRFSAPPAPPQKPPTGRPSRGFTRPGQHTRAHRRRRS